MTTLQHIKKIIKINKELAAYKLQPVNIILSIDDKEYDIYSINNLKQLKDEYVKEFIDRILNAELDDCTLTFNADDMHFATYNGKPLFWNLNHKVEVKLILG